jgi:DNA primase
MRFGPEFLDEIRARLPVSEVVGRRVKLKRQGREWAGLSPFNREKTPSFFVNDQKGFYHDFSSGKHGDIFTFLMETEGLGFPEAVEQLAGIAGVPLPRVTPEAEAETRRRATLHEAMEVAARFFEAMLAGGEGAAARSYLDGREVRPDTRAAFRMGYAPARRDALKRHLIGQGIDESLQVEAGLLIRPDDGPTYDRFRDRVMIPIHDARGRIIAFGGRALGDVQPKYLNSPETAVFHKGATVFNIHRARAPAFDAGDVVVVEGYMDVISLHQAGLTNVVATMGTAFTEEQIALLWRLAPEPVICFDGDAAGVGAAHRAVERILPHLAAGSSFNFAFLPAGLDPDDFVKARGRAAFEDLLKAAAPLFDVLWQRETAGVRFDTPERKAALEKRFAALAASIKDARVAQLYSRTVRLRLAELFWPRERQERPAPSYGGRGGRSARGERQAPLTPGRPVPIRRAGHRYGLQQIVLGLLVEYPTLLEDKYEAVAALHFDGELERFKNVLYRLLLEHETASVAEIQGELGAAFIAQLDAVHGTPMPDGRAAGWQLRTHFPIVAARPSENFIARCLDHFIETLHLYAVEDDLARLTTQIGQPGADEEALAERIAELVGEKHVMSERIQHRDTAFAEEAKELRRQFAPAPGWPAAA